MRPDPRTREIAAKHPRRLNADWRLALARAACVPLLFVAAACATPPRYPAQASLYEQRLDTTVDSPLARYYLEHYLSGSRIDEAMHARIDRLLRDFPSARPTREDLARLSRESSLDFAALFLVQRLMSDECNRVINREFMRELARASVPSNASRYVVLFAPGWDYIDLGPVTGADFARQRALATQHGVEHTMAALAPTGSIEANAAIMAREIARVAASGKRIIVTSASSAGPAVHVALAELVSPADRARVAGWLNIGGLLQGSPVVEYLLEWPQRAFFEAGVLWKGWDRAAIVELGTGPGRKRYSRLRLDPSMPVVDYIGIPLSGQVGPHARSNYPVLGREGPNDGLTLLADALAPGSLAILALGHDHFLADDPQIETKSLALLKLMIRLGEGEIAAGCTGAR